MPWADASRTAWVDEPFVLFHGAERIGRLTCNGGVSGCPQFWSGTLVLDEAASGWLRAYIELGRDQQRLLAGPPHYEPLTQ